MADIVRTGTDYLGNSDPGRDCRPVNDYIPFNVTMGVAVQAGQIVAVSATTGLGILADADAAGTAWVIGAATEKKGAGERVACVRLGVMSGYNISAQGVSVPVYLSGTAGELSDAAVGNGGAGYLVGITYYPLRENLIMFDFTGFGR